MSDTPQNDFIGRPVDELRRVQKQREAALERERAKGDRANQEVIGKSQRTLSLLEEALRDVEQPGVSIEPTQAGWPSEYYSASDEFDRARPHLERISNSIHPWSQAEEDAANQGTNDDRLQGVYDPDNILSRTGSFLIKELWKESDKDGMLNVSSYSHGHPSGIVLFHPEAPGAKNRFKKWIIHQTSHSSGKNIIYIAARPDSRIENEQSSEWAALDQVGMHIALQQCAEYPDALRLFTTKPADEDSVRSTLFWQVRQTIGQIRAADILSNGEFSKAILAMLRKENLTNGNDLGQFISERQDEFIVGSAQAQAAISKEIPKNEREIYGRIDFIVQSAAIFLAEQDVHSRHKNLRGMVNTTINIFKALDKQGKTMQKALVSLTERFQELNKQVISGGPTDWPAEYRTAEEELSRTLPHLQTILASIHPWDEADITSANEGSDAEKRRQMSFDPDNVIHMVEDSLLHNEYWLQTDQQGKADLHMVAGEHLVGIVLIHPEKKTDPSFFAKWALGEFPTSSGQHAIVVRVHPDLRQSAEHPSPKWAAVEQIGMHIALHQCVRNADDVLPLRTRVPQSDEEFKKERMWYLNQTVGQIHAADLLSENRYTREILNLLHTLDIRDGHALGEVLLQKQEEFLTACAAIHKIFGEELPINVREAFGRLEFIVHSACVLLAEPNPHAKEKNIVGMGNTLFAMAECFGDVQKSILGVLTELTEKFMATRVKPMTENEATGAEGVKSVEQQDPLKYAASCYAITLGELQKMGLGKREIADDSQEGLHRAAEQLLEGKIRPAGWILDSLKVIDRKKQEVLASDPAALRTKGVALPWELPDGASRDKWRQAMQELKRTSIQPMSHIIDEVITELMSTVFTASKLRLLSESQIQELFMTTGLFLQNLAKSIHDVYREAGVLPEETAEKFSEPMPRGSRMDILQHLMVALARECGELFPAVKDALLHYLEGLVKMYRNSGQTPLGTEPIDDLKLVSFGIHHGMSEAADIAALADVLTGEFPHKPHTIKQPAHSILRHNRSTMGYLHETQSKQPVMLSICPYRDVVTIGSTLVSTGAENFPVRQRYVGISAPSHDYTRSIAFDGKSFIVIGSGVSTTAFSLLPPSHNAAAQKNMHNICDRLPALHWRLRKLMYLHCPDLLRQEEPPEPLIFVEDENGVRILCHPEDLDRVQAMSGGTLLRNEELVELCQKYHALDNPTWTGVQLPSAAARQKELLGSAQRISGELLSGSTETDREVDEEAGGGNGSRDLEPLPKLPIIVGLLLKANLHASIWVDDTEVGVSGEEEGAAVSDLLPADCGEKGYAVLSIPEINLQILVSNQRGRAVYVVPDCKDPATYVGISPKELREDHDAQKITWDSDRQFMDSIENVLLERLGGAEFLPARKLLRDFPDEKSRESVRADTGKVVGMHNEHSRRKKEPWEASVGNFQKVKAGHTWAVGMTGAGATALDAYARGNDLHAPHVREQIVHLARGFGIDASSSTSMIWGFAAALGLRREDYGKFDDLKEVLAERYGFSKPTKQHLLRSLADELCQREEVNQTQGRVEKPQDIQSALRAAALGTMLYETYPEYRAASERRSFLRYAAETGHEVFAEPGEIDEEATIEKVRNLLRLEQEQDDIL
ncbi:MAG TPA: hypothetical protein VJB82_00505 [Candidatus Peribacterales bacterium]|nr:hypothetical protein [Candidatus Peribacterales bacterium]